MLEGKGEQTIIPQSRDTATDEQDCEVRRSDTENHEIYAGGLNVRAL